MKIGILTYHSVSNFGANLQALSTASFLRKRDIDAKIINWMPDSLKEYYIRTVPKIQRDVHAAFAEKYLSMTRLCVDEKTVCEVMREEQFDTVLIGSDAVFSYIPILCRIHPSRRTLIGISNVSEDHKFPNPFWGCFKDEFPKLKLCSISASAQYLDIDKCMPFEKKKLRHALDGFDIINVRDSWTKQAVERLTCRDDVRITPDPVFAFNDNVDVLIREPEIREKYSLPKNYVILSFCRQIFNNDWYEELYRELKRSGFNVVNLAMPEGILPIVSDKIIDIPIDPIDWYFLIKYSKAYIGQRMHPMIVAISNYVPVYIFDHYAFKHECQNSSKIYDLLKRAELLDSYCNISAMDGVIAPSRIVETISLYDRLKMENFLSTYRGLYVQMMNGIIGKV